MIRSFVVLSTVAIVFPSESLSQDTVRYLYQIPLEQHPETGRVYFEEVVQAPGISKSELYNRAREWFVRSFNSAESVLQMDDREAGKLAGRGWTNIEIESLQAIWQFKLKFLIMIELREGRYKLTFTDIEYQGHPTPKDINPASIPCESVIIDNLLKKNGEPKHVPRQYKEQTIKTWRRFSSELKDALARPMGAEDDW
ncbi:MAG: hypothetical protein GFGODING_02316 [Flavobacteriales bacterium]|nr:hypothetical protein [Flavobacteriales bacterium]